MKDVMDEKYKKEYETLIRYIESDYPESLDGRFAGMVVNSNRVLFANSPEGIKVKWIILEDNALNVNIRVDPGIRIDTPVHLCFGILNKIGKQKINMDIEVGKDSVVKFVSHCIFPNSVDISHLMDARIHLHPGARMEYHEVHIHGKSGHITLVPSGKVRVDAGAEFKSYFTLKSGIAGDVDIDYEISIYDDAVCFLESKIHGREKDKIKIKESVFLKGNNSKGIIKTRVVLRDYSFGDITGEIIGEGDNSKGHVDCMEVVFDNAVAKASPIVFAKNPKSKVTHEAAIGSIDRKQLITLMARGLSEEEAIDIIVGGLLR